GVRPAGTVPGAAPSVPGGDGGAAPERRARSRPRAGRALDGRRAQGPEERPEGAPIRRQRRARSRGTAAGGVRRRLPPDDGTPRSPSVVFLPERVLRGDRPRPPGTVRVLPRAARQRGRLDGAPPLLGRERLLVPRRHRRARLLRSPE